ncbi:TVP38/TMEM64 family protein [Psychrobacillus sp. NPDC096426]|uniref:TVP38/TMEM64 family protein n=1 Tax=Psychrobacillus sp. NPDC096426 TaxID=3364491 RepID=UPI00380F4325
MKKIIIKLSRKKQWLLWGSVLLLLLFFVLNQDLISLLLDGDVEKIRNFLHKNMSYAFIFMALVMLIQNSFTVFPLILVITINITLFGFWNGFLWSWFTSILSAIIVFYGTRYILQDMIIEKFNARLIEKVDSSGLAYVFQARIFPFVPTSLVNILGGLSTIRILPFSVATAIGNFFYFFVLALIPAGILKANFNEYVIWIIVLAAVLLYYFIKMIRKKRKA